MSQISRLIGIGSVRNVWSEVGFPDLLINSMEGRGGGWGVCVCVV